MTDTALEAVLRRDRAVVAAALFVMAVLAWTYVLWLAANMDMGGKDMTDFRMISAGAGLMMPTNAPWHYALVISGKARREQMSSGSPQYRTSVVRLARQLRAQ